MSEARPKAFESLTILIERDEPVALFTVEKTIPPPNLEIQLASTGYQMITTAGEILAPAGAEPIHLDAADVPDMLQPAEPTNLDRSARAHMNLAITLGSGTMASLSPWR
jgi:hypothetical protein